MITDNTFTVYIHIFPNNKRYVGITGQALSARWRVNGNGYKPQRFIYKAIKKYGWENIKHVIVAEKLSASEAGELEKKLIAQYNTTDPDYGYNQSTGGENSPIGVKRSDETRERLRQSHLGKKPWNKGQPLSDSAKQRLREVNLGKKHSESTKRKISEKNKGKKPSAFCNLQRIKACSKPVIRICDGMQFDSATQAALETGETLNTITNHCRKEVRSPRWKYQN